MIPPSPSAVLLVDGYNIIGSWNRLIYTRDRKGLEAARRELTEALISYSAFQGFDTKVVFDAHYRDTPGNGEVITEHLSVYYTDFGQTADTYIEKACATLRHELRVLQRRLIVATSDRAQQLMVMGYGAEWMSAQKLAFDIESTAHRLLRKNKPRKQSSGRFLANSLDAKARQRLTELRMGLKD
jgi:uncharacterized protein